jgi:hypothetical protein
MDLHPKFTPQACLQRYVATGLRYGSFIIRIPIGINTDDISHLFANVDCILAARNLHQNSWR